MRRSCAVLSFAFLAFVVAACGDDENQLDPDAGDDNGVVDAPPGGEEVLCETLPLISAGTCEVTAATGGNANTVIKGVVLTPGRVYRGGRVVVDAEGKITYVGCDYEDAGARVISCPDGVISPGLINPHDHITFAQNNPYNDQGFRYEHRHQWRRGDGPTRPEIDVESMATADEIRWGELRFLMGGATSIVGSGGQAGLTRNLDRANLFEAGMEGQKAVDFETFPLDDGSSATRRTMDCNYGSRARTAASIDNLDSFEPHTSEGIDASARNEFLCQSSDNYDTTAPGISHKLTGENTAMIHAIGLLPADLSIMATTRTGLVWSPRSNITLYGDTARVTIAKTLGVEISLGTDWMPTGSMNLLRELQCADELNTKYYNKAFSDEDLWRMVTINAASATGTDDVLGELKPGKLADISIYAAKGKTYRAVLEAQSQDVVLVMRGGKTLYGDAPVVAGLAADCEELDVCTAAKRMCITTEIGKTYAALKTSLPGIYEAFPCGVPANEPSCTPERPTAIMGSSVYTGETSATDSDGDGIPNASDKCPMIFDPIRPVDNGMQGDADGDGEGDACDVCPLDADSTSCTTANPDDTDGDGVLNNVDNCPSVDNANQTDGDGDMKGDACDACPAVSNPDAAGCPGSIYDIKDGTTPVGTNVVLTNVLVTGKGTNGFFVQMKVGDTGYEGSDYSGLFVFTSTPAYLAAAVIGTRVTMTGAVALFQGQLQLFPTAVTQSTTVVEPLPAPVPATYATVKSGGTRAAQLEGVSVTLGPATVVSVDAMFFEFVVTDGAGNNLPVDDFLYLTSPLPTVGRTFTGLTGVVGLRTAGGGMSVNKLLPRSAADLAQGAPGIASFGPETGFTRVGASAAATFPSPLTVTLNGPAQGNTVVTVTSGTPTALTVTNVTVLNGETTAQVPVTALVQATAVTLTASLGATTDTAVVRVLGAAEAPTMVVLTPAAATVAPAGTVQLTVGLDLPAPTGGTTVTLGVSPIGAGTVPATVVVPANATTAAFTFTETAGSGTATVTAALGASTAISMVMVTTAVQRLVINEVDYNQEVNPDAREFIEIFNPGSAAISLTGKQLLLLNGSGATPAPYSGGSTYNLPSVSLAAGAYLVVGAAGLTVGPNSTLFTPTGWTTDEIQNGAPDGILLIDNTAKTLIDALAYQGDMGNYTPPGFPAAVSFGTGTTGTVLDGTVTNTSICRVPNGQDTDNTAMDWAFCTTTTGAPNVVAP